MDIRKRREASLDCLFETYSRVGLQEVYHRNYVRQQVLGSVFGLTGKDRDLRLDPLTLGNVTGNL